MSTARAVVSALGALAISAAALPESAVAACQSSTASQQTFLDSSSSDSESGLAPEIVSVSAALDASCTVVATAALANRTGENGLIEGDSVGIYLDVDGNSATGSPDFGGADKVVIFVGHTGADVPPGLGTWNGSTFSFADATFLTAAGPAGFRASLDVLGIQAPTAVGIRAFAIWRGASHTYSDAAPDVLAPSFRWPVSFSTSSPAPAPAPPAAPAPPPTTPAPAPPAPPAPAPSPTAPTVPAPAIPPTRETGEENSACRVPRVVGMPRRLAMRRLFRSPCSFRVKRVYSSRVKKGRVVSTSPRAGVRTTRTVVVRISRGKRRPRMLTGALRPAYAAAAASLRRAAEATR